MACDVGAEEMAFGSRVDDRRRLHHGPVCHTNKCRRGGSAKEALRKRFTGLEHCWSFSCMWPQELPVAQTVGLRRFEDLIRTQRVLVARALMLTKPALDLTCLLEPPQRTDRSCVKTGRSHAMGRSEINCSATRRFLRIGPARSAAGWASSHRTQRLRLVWRCDAGRHWHTVFVAPRNLSSR